MATVPFYSLTFFVLSIITMILPVLAIQLSNLRKKTNIVQKLVQYFTGYCALHGYYYDFNDEPTTAEQKKDYIKNDLASHYFAEMEVFFIFEDAIQFAIQIINAFLIGQSWTWIMILSPLTSIYSVVFRANPRPNKAIRQSLIFDYDFDSEKEAIYSQNPDLNEEQLERKAIWQSQKSRIFTMILTTMFFYLIQGFICYFCYYFVLHSDHREGWTN